MFLGALGVWKRKAPFDPFPGEPSKLSVLSGAQSKNKLLIQTGVQVTWDHTYKINFKKANVAYQILNIKF